MLKATLEAQKRELDEALEIEKIRRDERERESKRQKTELRLREEANLAESKRERERLDSLALQIKVNFYYIYVEESYIIYMIGTMWTEHNVKFLLSTLLTI